ncbi:hypothetical protein DSCOOX_56470 [Desulfosarcina ovata subsp. ovata]|uniref:Uncharacterized protein n=2 Tax=Desulfosarcina ovata TaxID=83564 RepID=A0A5K8AIH5_9BACT|nr:hypothetical protein DSCOOX_56470 [Desulfosarcina ovata subsp. ovata]
MESALAISDAYRTGLIKDLTLLDATCASVTARLSGRSDIAPMDMSAVPLPKVFKPMDGKPPVEILITFGLKFASTITDELRQGLVDLNVPVVNVIRPYLESIDAWC